MNRRLLLVPLLLAPCVSGCGKQASGQQSSADATAPGKAAEEASASRPLPDRGRGAELVDAAPPPSEEEASEPGASTEEDSIMKKEAEAPPQNAPDLARLDKEESALNQFLDSTKLSCGDARPRVDSICAIADRLCKDQAVSLHAAKDCDSAKKVCERSKRRYRAACEK